MTTTTTLAITTGLLTVPAAQLVADPDRPLLLLLHGRGSNERDLARFIPLLPQRYAFGLLRAPLPFGEGFSWFSSETEPDVVLSANEPAAAVEAWLQAKSLDVPAREISLLGFSGGGVTSLQLLKRRPERYRRVVNLSGYVTADDAPGAPTASTPPRVFWGRDVDDRAITPDKVQATDEWLRAHADVVAQTYPGIAHSISEEEIADVAEFLNS